MTSLAIRTNAEPAALVPQSVHPLQAILAPFESRVLAVLPADVPFRRIVQELSVVAEKNPALVKAIEHNPARSVAAISEALQTGLIIGKTVHIVPFWNKGDKQYDWTVMADYKGYIELMDASGMPANGDVRWDCDTFDYALGTDPFVKHVPGPVAKRKMILGAYAVGHRRRGFPPLVKYVDRAEIEAVRKKSKSWGPDKVAELERIPWYATKTAIRRLANQAPKNPRLAALLDREEPDFGEITATATIATESTEVHAADPDTGAIAAPDDGLTLAQAQDVVVNRQALGQMRNSGLTAALAWAREKLDTTDGDDSRLVRIAAACTMLLAAREAGTLVEPPKKEKPAAAPKLAPAPAPSVADADDDLPF